MPVLSEECLQLALKFQELGDGKVQGFVRTSPYELELACTKFCDHMLMYLSVDYSCLQRCLEVFSDSEGKDLFLCINLFVGTKPEVHKTYPHPLKTNRQRKESSLGLATVPVWMLARAMPS